MGRRWKAINRDAPSNAGPMGRRDHILAVGLTDAQRDSLPAQLFGALGRAAVMARFSDLTPERLWSTMAIMSPLVALDFDAVDLANHLISNDFQGRYYAFAFDVPDTSLICREVATIAPDLPFELIDMRPNFTIVPSHPITV